MVPVLVLVLLTTPLFQSQSWPCLQDTGCLSLGPSDKFVRILSLVAKSWSCPSEAHIQAAPLICTVAITFEEKMDTLQEISSYTHWYYPDMRKQVSSQALLAEICQNQTWNSARAREQWSRKIFIKVRKVLWKRTCQKVGIPELGVEGCGFINRI